MTDDEAEAMLRRTEYGRDRGDADQTEERRRDKEGFDWDGFKKRIDAAVKRGDLSEDAAEQKLMEMRRRMSESR